jgi:hypothetical protein
MMRHPVHGPYGNMFSTFWAAGVEFACHINRAGFRVDTVVATARSRLCGRRLRAQRQILPRRLAAGDRAFSRAQDVHRQCGIFEQEHDDAE